MYCLREAAKALGVDLAGATTAIQGYGNAGSFAHKLGVEMFGLKVVAVSDSRGGIFAPDGLDFAAVSAHKAKTGSVINFPGAQNITNETLLELDVTVLIPAALENAINEDNVAASKASSSSSWPTAPLPRGGCSPARPRRVCYPGFPV